MSGCLFIENRRLNSVMMKHVNSILGSKALFTYLLKLLCLTLLIYQMSIIKFRLKNLKSI